MGNRAVITTKENFNNNGVGVYVHWNGGRNSIEAFLTYCKLKGYRDPANDCYGWARLCQVIGNYFGGDCSVGIDICRNLDCDNGDNGVYIIKNWEIVDRKYFNGVEQSSYDLYEFLKDIDNSMPEKERISGEIERIFYKKKYPMTKNESQAVEIVLAMTRLGYNLFDETPESFAARFNYDIDILTDMLNHFMEYKKVEI